MARTRNQQQQTNRDDGNNTTTGKQEYEEQAGWASAFFRPDAEGDQPHFTGPGKDEDGDDIQVSVWLRRSKNGTRYLRIHLEPPFEKEMSGATVEAELDNMPF